MKPKVASLASDASAGKFPFHYGGEADQYTFYRIPKLLFDDAVLRQLSTDAKVLYGLMLDRMSLSLKNGWLDDEGRVFIYFSLENIMEQLGCGRGKCTKLLQELDDQNGIGLITRVKQGLGKPDVIYVHMYTQLFNLLCDKADDEHGGRLPYHVRLLLDEFANIGRIPKFDKLIATIRSREISASIILQSQSQLKSIYKDAAETIIGNCDTTLFLGGKESSTLKEISETLGKETIDLFNTSDTRGQSRSYGLNYQKTGKELMTRDELAVMDGGKCILQLRGVRPFLSDKFDITRHKRYKELSDFSKKNAFDVEQYMRCQLRMRADDEVEVFEIEVDGAEAG